MTDPRDEVWAAVYRLWYDAEYNAELSERLVDRWQSFDDLSKVIVSLTATGSVVAGWALWAQGGFKHLWAVLAGVGAIISIVSSALGVPERLKVWAQSKGEFRAQAIRCQALRLAMRVDPQFDVREILGAFEDIRARFGETVGRLPSDILDTGRLRKACQSAVDELVKDEQLLVTEGARA